MIAPGTLLAGKYRIEKILGRGGMGIVYAARQEPLGRPVAVKVLNRDLLGEGPFRERFKREAMAAAALQHRNLVQVTDLVTEGEHVFLVMERLVGTSLGAVMTRAGSLPQDRVATIGSQVLGGLAVAHEAGLVHRDVKPDNIFLLSPGDEDELVKLLDFGIVKSISADAITSGSNVLGTWQYMPPEQARGTAIDCRADLYSLGACLYYAVSGMRPYQAASMDRTVYALSPTPPPPLVGVRSDLDPAFCAVIERALAKDVAGRWPSAAEMRAALAPFVKKALPAKMSGTVRMTDAPPVSGRAPPQSSPSPAAPTPAQAALPATFGYDEDTDAAPPAPAPDDPTLPRDRVSAVPPLRVASAPTIDTAPVSWQQAPAPSPSSPHAEEPGPRSRRDVATVRNRVSPGSRTRQTVIVVSFFVIAAVVTVAALVATWRLLH